MPSNQSSPARAPLQDASSRTPLWQLAGDAMAFAVQPGEITWASLFVRLRDLQDSRPAIEASRRAMAMMIRPDATLDAAAELDSLRGDAAVTSIADVDRGLRDLIDDGPDQGDVAHLLVALHAISNRERTLRPEAIEGLIQRVGRLDPASLAQATLVACRPQSSDIDLKTLLYGKNPLNRLRRQELPEWKAVTLAIDDQPLAAEAVSVLNVLRNRCPRKMPVTGLAVLLLVIAAALGTLLFTGSALWAAYRIGQTTREVPGPAPIPPAPDELVVRKKVPLSPCPTGLLEGPVLVIVADGEATVGRDAFKAAIVKWTLDGLEVPTISPPDDAEANSSDSSISPRRANTVYDYDTFPLAATVPAWAYAKPDVLTPLLHQLQGPTFPSVGSVVVVRTLRGGTDPLVVVTAYRPGQLASTMAMATGEVILPTDYQPLDADLSVFSLHRRTVFPEGPSAHLVADAIAAWASDGTDAAVAAALIIRSATKAKDRAPEFEHARTILRNAYCRSALPEKALLMLALLESDENRITVIAREKTLLDPNRAGTLAVSGDVLAPESKTDLLMNVAREILMMTPDIGN